MDFEASGNESVDLTFLHSILPEDYQFIITDYSRGSEQNEFDATIRLAISAKEEALKWLKEFEEKSLTTWKVERACKECTPRLIFKKEYHCQHNTKPRMGSTPREKHTNCPSKLTITIKQYMKRSEDKYIKTHPCQVYIRFHHNHELKRGTPSNDVRRAFEDLFMKNHSPSSALQTYKFDLRLQHGNDYYKLTSDGAICPSQKWVCDLYYKVFKKEYGDPDGDDMINSMEKYIEDYNVECGEACAISTRSDAGFTVALCSPLMKRVHTMLEISKDIIFIDSSGNMDRHNSRVFILMCASPVGALPLGLFITYSESEESISQGLALLLSIFPESAFYGQHYATAIITDDCIALRNSLRKTFPASKLFLCIFHVLQNVMRYLWLAENDVQPEDRQNLYRIFQKGLYMKNIEEFKKNVLFLNEACKNYENVKSYFEKLGKRADEWALCYRETLTHGNNTNNYYEASFRILKDKIFQRLKYFNILQLFHFLISKFDNFYCMKITDVINGRANKKNDNYFPESKLRGLEVSYIRNSLYSVQNNSSNQTYTIDTVTCYCTCYIGSSGGPCKHQFLVSKTFNIPLQFLNNKDISSKLKFQKIAYGNNVADWYDSLIAEEPCCLNIEKNASVDENTSSNSCVPKILFENLDDSCNSVTQLDIGSNETVQNFDKCSDELKLVFQDLNDKLTKNPAVYAEPVKKFIENYNKCKTESAILSALHTFGKYNGMPSIKKGKNVQGGRQIGVQPTAIARRKIKIGGRTISKCGRPSKSSFIDEPGYGKRKIEKTNFPRLPIQVKIAKPLLLSLSVDDLKVNNEN